MPVRRPADCCNSENTFKFELRKSRRTFGQRAIDKGQSIHDVSLVMGHATMATAQTDYCDKDEHNAARDMQKFWVDMDV